MSYNIDTWKTKRLENLTIPREAFYRSERTDWHPECDEGTDLFAGQITLHCGCDQTIKGTLDSGQIRITEFDMAGEGSGTLYHEILEPALKESRGYLEAVLVWEGGDSITRLVVNDGEVTSEEIEL